MGTEERLSDGRANAARGAWILAGLACLIAMAGAFLTIPAFFPTNDDAYAHQILSGGISSSPTARIMFINYGLCWIFSLLYTVVPAVPWWVVGHLVALFLSISLIGRTLLVKLRIRGVSCSVLLQLVSLAAADYGLFAVLIARLQFTTTASLLVAAAIISTCAWNTDERAVCGSVFTRTILPAVMAVWGFAMRSQSGYLGMFFWLSAIAVMACAMKGSLKNRVIQLAPMIKPVAVAGVAALALLAINAMEYSSPEWQGRRELASEFAAFTDYPRVSYDEDPDLYDSVGWDEDLLALASDWYFMDERISSEALRTINEGNTAGIDNLRSDFWGIIKSRATDLRQPTSLAYLLVFVAMGVLALRGAQGKAAKSLVCGAAFVAGVLMAYLLVKGRLPERAIWSITIPATAALASIALRGMAGNRRADARRSLAQRLVVIGLSVLFILPGLLAVRQYGWGSEDYATRSRREENIEAFHAYASEHEDTFYFYAADTNLTSQYIWRLWWPDNVSSWGGWQFCYDWFESGMRDAGFDGVPMSEDFFRGNVCVVLRDNATKETFTNYMSDLFGPVDLELVDTITSEIQVYRVVGKEA